MSKLRTSWSVSTAVVAMAAAALLGAAGVGNAAAAEAGHHIARSTAACTPELGPGQGTLTVPFDGTDYPVAVYVPPVLKTPSLVLDLHGTGSTGTGQLAYSELETTAAANGFVIAAPNGANVSGSGYAWNVPGFPSSSGRDDVGFLSTVMDVVTAAQCTDPGRIYAAGYSGGGRMVSALACQLAGKLAAIAPVAGVRAGTPLAPDPSQPDPATCQPSRPVPVIAFHGQQDNTNPYNGGGSDVWQYSVPAAMTRWAQIDGCATTPQTSQVTTHVSELTYAGCSAGTQLELYAVSNGGHTWPGTSQPSPGNGITTEEISADNLMWAFFSQFGTNTPPPTNDTGPIVGLANKCVDVRGADTTDGTPVQLYTCNGTDAQQWTVGTDGTLRALGKCLDVTGGGTTNGTPVQLWDCNGNSHQQWTYSGGRLINPNSAKCLDVTGQNPADSTPLQIWDCNGQTNQNWTLPTT